MLEQCVNFCCEIISKLPLDCMQFSFMQIALLTTLFLAPLTAVAGVQVVNYRMAFFADTIGHSVFAGAALGALFLGNNGAVWGMPLTALLIGIGVLFLQKTGKQASDTVIGVFFAFIVALGLLLMSNNHNLPKAGQFIFGDILLVTAQDTALLMILTIIYAIFITTACNPLLLIAIDEDLARAHRIKSMLFELIHISLLALIVIFTVKIAGVLLAGAMLIVPAAAARNLVKHAGRMFWSAAVIGLISGVSGLFISAQERANFPAGATMVMVSCIIFAISTLWKKFFTN